MVSVMLISLSTRAILEVLYVSNQISCLLLPGIPDPSTVMSCGILAYFFPRAKGLQSSRGGYFAIAKQYHGKYSPYFLLLLYCDEEGVGGLSYLISDRLSLVSAFPLNYLEEENK